MWRRAQKLQPMSVTSEHRAPAHLPASGWRKEVAALVGKESRGRRSPNSQNNTLAAWRLECVRGYPRPPTWVIWTSTWSPSLISNIFGVCVGLILNGWTERVQHSDHGTLSATVSQPTFHRRTIARKSPARYPSAKPTDSGGGKRGEGSRWTAHDRKASFSRTSRTARSDMHTRGSPRRRSC